jgi:hypothetical protein
MYNFPFAERCVGKMKIVMQSVFQGWKVVLPYYACIHVLAESNVSQEQLHLTPDGCLEGLERGIF